MEKRLKAAVVGDYAAGCGQKEQQRYVQELGEKDRRENKGKTD